jgi:hypothetical protein
LAGAGSGLGVDSWLQQQPAPQLPSHIPQQQQFGSASRSVPDVSPMRQEAAQTLPGCANPMAMLDVSKATSNQWRNRGSLFMASLNNGFSCVQT